MAKAAIPKLIETKLAGFLNSESWNGGTATAYESLGAQMPSMPFIRVEVDQGNEEPENYGNYKVTVEVTAYGGLDPENDSNYTAITTAHSTLCGNIHDSLNGLGASDLTGTVSGFTNELTVYDVWLRGFNRDIDTSNGVFEDVWQLEIYCKVS